MTTTSKLGIKPSLADVAKSALAEKTLADKGAEKTAKSATAEARTEAASASQESQLGRKHDVFDRVKAPGAGTAGDVNALLAKFGLEQVQAQPATKKKVEKRFAANIRKLVGGLVERQKKVVTHAFSAMKSFGLAALHCTSWNDVVQLKDFAKLAIENGRPLEVFGILRDVAEFLWRYPEEARRVMDFLDKAEQDTWKQKSAWQAAAVNAVDKNVAPLKRAKADVVVIGGGLSAGHIMRNFADAFRDGGDKPRTITVLEKDSLAKREHAASLRNAGIVSTALDYIFDLDEAIGEKPVDRIAEALAISPSEAEKAYESIHQVMHEAGKVIRDFLKAKHVDVDAVDYKAGGGLDIVHTVEDLQVLREQVKQARALGLDWEAIDAKVLDAKYHVKSDDIAGALEMKDSAIVHPGKLVKALFEYAQQTDKNIDVEYDTEVLHAKHDERGDGWILVTNKGEIHAKDVVDAREAYAPYKFREARFSQIHILDVGADGKPMQLGETNVCHSLTYMRKIGAGKFLVGSGDFPLRDPQETPQPMTSVALYAAAHFKKLYPDVPYNIEKVWGGVFGLSTDGLPVSGALLKGWHVVGGAGGSGLNITPATGKQVVDEILGHPERGPLQPAADFGPRRFFLKELRTDLAAALHQLSAFHDVDVERVRVEIAGPSRTSRAPVVTHDELVFYVDESVLDAMNTDAAVLFGPQGPSEIERREHNKGAWIKAQVDAVRERSIRGAAVVGGLAPASP